MKSINIQRLLLGSITFVFCVISFSCSSSKTLYPVKIQSYYGFIDPKGHLLIAPQYVGAQYFQDGLAPVQRLNRSLAFLDYHGTEIEVSETYGPVEKLDVFSNKLARAVVGGLLGYVNPKGEWVIPPQYKIAGRFSEGLAGVLIAEEERGFYIDASGKEIFALDNLTALGPFRGSRAYFVRNHRFGLLDNQGKIIKEAEFLFLGETDSASGLTRALDEKTELYGYIDRSGFWAISPRYPNAGDFSEGYASVFLRNYNKYGYIDSRGTVRIAAEFLDASKFSNGIAWVRDEAGYRYINQKGEWVSPLVFDYANSFFDGVAHAQQGDEIIYLNKRGRVIWPQEAEEERV